MGVISAVAWPNDKVYLFEGEKYRKLDGVSGAIDGAPRAVTEGWRGLDGSPDAVVWWGCGKAYMFFGPHYVRYDSKNDRVDPEYLPPNPQPTIAGNWPGVWEGGVDAAVNWGNGKIYFFRGAEYLRYDITLDRVDDGYPQPLSAWPGLWPDGIHAVAYQGGAKAWFFRGDEFRRYDVASDTVDASGNVNSFGIDPVPSGMVAAARDLTPQQANGVTKDLIRRGLVSLRGGTTAPASGARVVISPPALHGVRYTNVIAPSASVIDNVDQRMLVALHRLARWINASHYDVAEILHLGIGHGAGPPNDCHNQGRALDFSGVVGAVDGVSFRREVKRDWGNLPAGPTVRIDPAHDRIAFDLFATAHRFGTFECEGNGIGPANRWPPPDLGGSGFVIYPDYGGDPALRAAHQDHVHMQVGPTRV